MIVCDIVYMRYCVIVIVIVMLVCDSVRYCVIVDRVRYCAIVMVVAIVAVCGSVW